MKYKAGLVGDLSGSIGSVTASHNAYGTYFRRRGTPVNPDTAGQREQRNAFSVVSRSYRSLTTEQQNAWGQYAQDHPKTPRSGGTAQVLAAAAMYACINVPRQRTGMTILAAVPPAEAAPAFTEVSLGATCTVTGGVSAFNITVAAGNGYILSTAKVGSSGRRFVNSYAATDTGIGGGTVTTPLPFTVAVDDVVAYSITIIPQNGGLPTTLKGTVTVANGT